ncbi:MAG: Hsp20/alpha crystallin family protein [Kiritimatiellae bacterium]|nr:Hsp20/alpha crystallin family protein [Kiritimatiellia bacterium]
MSIRDLVPWRNRSRVPARRSAGDNLLSLRDEMDRVFDEFFSGFGLTPFRELDDRFESFAPKVDVKETDRQIQVSAELPGLDDKDVQVTLDDDMLYIRGEKKDEHEEKEGDWHRVERAYGSFARAIPLPAAVDAEKVKAKFKKGVLSVTLPKLEPGKEKKTVEIDAA